MTLDARLKELLDYLVGGRLYAIATPDTPLFPLIVYQQVGGQAGWYVEKRMPDHEHARLQIWVWARGIGQAKQISAEVERIICESELIAEPYGAAVDDYQEQSKLYGRRQDFGVWYPR